MGQGAGDQEPLFLPRRRDRRRHPAPPCPCPSASPGCRHRVPPHAPPSTPRQHSASTCRRCFRKMLPLTNWPFCRTTPMWLRTATGRAPRGRGRPGIRCPNPVAQSPAAGDRAWIFRNPTARQGHILSLTDSERHAVNGVRHLRRVAKGHVGKLDLAGQIVRRDTVAGRLGPRLENRLQTLGKRDDGHHTRHRGRQPEHRRRELSKGSVEGDEGGKAKRRQRPVGLHPLDGQRQRWRRGSGAGTSG